MKKAIALILVLVMAVGLFAGCKKADTASVYYLNFKPEQDEQWQALAKVYTEKTGVPVTVVTAASGTYETTLTSEIAKDEPPTLFQVNGPVGYSNWKDYCLDLKDSEAYKQLTSDDFAIKEGDSVYGIAYVIETYGIIVNQKIINAYAALPGALITNIFDINSFETLKAVADDMQAKKAELGIDGAFASAGMDSSSDWRFKTHLANLPLYYEYKDEGNFGVHPTVTGKYLDNYKAIWDLYINDSTCEPALLSSKTGDDALAEFKAGKAAFYQNGTWAYNDIKDLGDENLGMLPIYIGAEGEEGQGLCTGSENYWCVNSKASEVDQKATVDFINWVVTSDEGRSSLANDMGFVCPFKTFADYLPENTLVKIANDMIASGKSSVAWCFPTMPSENWKNGVGSALTAYAAGTGSWDDVKAAFVDGWATEYQATFGK